MIRPLVRTASLLLPVVLLGCPRSPSDEKPPQDPSGVFISPQGITNSQTVFVRGLIERDATGDVFFNPECTGTAAASGPSATFAAQGLQVIIPPNTTTVISTRARKGELTSGCTIASAITHDDAPPSAPLISQVELVNVFPVRVAVSGTTEAGATVRLFFKAGCTGESREAKAEGNGVYRIESEIPANATTVFSAQATDVATNVSGCSSPFSFVHDDVPPQPPTLNGVSPKSPSTAQQVTVTGTAEPNAQVRLYRDAGCSVSLSSAAAVAAANGSFSQQISVVQNTTTQIYGRATDPSGNHSGCSSPVSYTHDSLHPAAPVLGPSDPPSPSNSLNFTLEIAAEGGGQLQLHALPSCGGAPILSGTMPQGGVAAANLTATANGTRSFSARITDAAGNMSNCSTAFHYTHDGNAPNAPVLTGTTPASPGNTTSPSIQATAEPYSTVEFYRSAGCAGSYWASGTATGAGNVSATISVLSNSTTSFSARAIDAAGNVSACSTTALTYTHDGIAPSAALPAGTLPPTPSRSGNVQVLGMGELGTTAQVFSSTSCLTSTLLGSAAVGPAQPGSTSGRGPFVVNVTVSANNAIPLAVNLLDGAGNTSGCVLVTPSFLHDTGRGWRDIAPLAAPGVEGYAPTVLLTGTGATAVWARQNGTTSSTIMASDYAAGAWATPVAVTGSVNHLLDPVRLAADQAGNVYAVWSQYGAGRAFSGESFGARRTAAGVWDVPSSFGAETYEPDVAAGGAGEVIAAYRSNASTTESQILTRRFLNGAWSAAVRVDTTTLSDFAPRVAVTSNGEGLVLFTENAGSVASPNDQLWSVRYSGGNWQAPQRRSSYDRRVRRGEYAIMSGGSGRAVAAWLETTTSSSSTFRPATSRYSTTGFGSNTLIGYSSSDARSIALAVNVNDAAMVVASQFASNQLGWSRSAGHTSTGTGFSTSLSNLWPSSPTLASGTPVRVAYAPDGTAVAAWIGADRMENGSSLWFSTWSGTSWGMPQLLEQAIDPMDTFDVAMNNDRIVAVWTRTDGAGVKTVHARVLD